jgi:hypothetical protein
LACLAVVGIFQQDSLSSSREIYFGSLIAIKIMTYSSSQSVLSLSQGNLVAWTILSAMMPTRLGRLTIDGTWTAGASGKSTILALSGRTAPMGKAIKSAPKQTPKALLSQTNRQNQTR